MKPKRKLTILSFIIFSFSLIILNVDGFFEDELVHKYSSLISSYLFNNEKAQITDVVNSTNHILDTSLASSLNLYQEMLDANAEHLALMLDNVEPSLWCSTLENYTTKHTWLQFELSDKKQSKCSSLPRMQHHLTDCNTSDNNASDDLIVHSTQLAESHTLKLKYSKQLVIDNVKAEVADLIRNIKLENDSLYIRIVELNEEAIAQKSIKVIVNPQEPDLEQHSLIVDLQGAGEHFLSSKTAEQIVQEGSSYFTAYIIDNDGNIVRERLTFAKINPVFGWAITAGYDLSSYETLVASQKALLEQDFDFHNQILSVVVGILSLIVITVLLRLERYSLRVKTNQLAIQHKEQEVRNYQEVLTSMLDLVERRDSYTAGHTRRVAEYAVLIANHMKLPKEDIAILYEAAMMHDIGKVSTPDSILLKPGKLSKHEYEIIKNHLESGYEILSSIKAFQRHADIMRDHHERFDGKGYPRGRKASEISLLSHILILVDAFDAMTSKRIYRESKTIVQALDEIKSLSGIQFHPDVVEAAVPVLKDTQKQSVSHDYLSNEFEQARLAYYYKDPLTGLFNYRFFEHILSLNKDLYGRHYRCCYFINLVNFHHFNKCYGWLAGDDKLAAIGETLSTRLPQSIIFRVFGDDFLVLSEQHIKLNDTELEQSFDFKDAAIKVELHHFDLDHVKFDSFKDLSSCIEELIQYRKR